MAVYKRGKKGVFYMDFIINGIRVFKSTRKSTKKEAKQVEAAEKQMILQASSITPQQKLAKMSLSAAIEAVYNSRWKNNKDGMGSYRRAVKLLEHVGNVPLSAIDDDAVDLLVMTLDATGIENSTVNRYLAALKTVFKHFRQQTDFIKLRKEMNGRIRIVSKDEEARIVELLRGAEIRGKKGYYVEAADMVEVLIDTGMRLSELLNLKYDDINFTSNLISIWINKGDKPRSIPMTGRVRSILKERQQINKYKPFSITVSEAERAWKWMRTEKGMEQEPEPIVIHSLRHTTASRLVNAGVDLYVVKEWLGHSSIQITERYAHLSPVKLSEACKVLEN